MQKLYILTYRSCGKNLQIEISEGTKQNIEAILNSTSQNFVVPTKRFSIFIHVNNFVKIERKEK